ncbi:hypothetical protein [Haloarcula rubripromontorii]|uniref:Uncharacterized protein n=1 Tax=Haloarcula rubripromontorii TaxID=1705562 RepID=A0A0M9ANK0_9EURY|nr:hypothetical protein [Haloarcula rubripromontorii]KOX95138.1 hypothetical protein AMS69_04605 [Haloarcula rubripromontorii]NLV04873.1 hypothetical protein [Haloarcula rubripromontorii]
MAANDVFTETDDSAESWVDVRMTDPDEGEWDVDVVIAEKQVEYVDLRIRPELLEGFFECLFDDLSDERARSLLSTTMERQGIDPADLAESQ